MTLNRKYRLGERVGWAIGNVIAWPVYWACNLCPPLDRKVREWLA